MVSTAVAPYYVPPAMHKGFTFSTFLSTLFIFCFFPIVAILISVK